MCRMWGQWGLNMLTPLVPEYCPICQAKYVGGHAAAGTRMKIGLRVFYDCGASLSIKKGDVEEGVYHLLLKNCWCDENVKEISPDFIAEENDGRETLRSGDNKTCS